MPYPITRIPTDDAVLRDARAEELRLYIEQRLLLEYSPQHPSLMLDVVVARRSDYDEVKVFLTQEDLVNDVKTFLRRIEDDLAAEGIAILTYVRTWTGPASQLA
ncbi:MAG: hypothetical protein ACRYFS_13315 [Janthinobacterium lividum]